MSLLRKTEFVWSNGNIVQIDQSAVDSSGNINLLGSSFYEYDNSRNYSNQDIAFMYAIHTLPVDETILSGNNVTAAKFDWTSDDQGVATAFTCEFTYNIQNYPQEIKYSSAVNGNLTNYKMIYE